MAAPAIVMRGRETSVGKAVAARLPEADLTAGDARKCSGAIFCGWPDEARDAELVRSTAEALAGSGKPLLYVSTAWVMGDTRGRLAGEAAPLRPPASLAWLPEVERVLLFDAPAKGVRSIVVRPAVIYGGEGERDAVLEAGGIGAGDNHWSFVHVDDLADLIVLAWQSAPAGGLYVAADGPPVPCGRLRSARGIAAPPADAWGLDQRAGSTRAFRELGWRPSRPPVLRWLDA